MILAATLEEREAAMADCCRCRKMILRDPAGHDRLAGDDPALDPPLHEFLPNREALLLEVDRLRREGGDGQLLLQREELPLKVRALAEQNPMLGIAAAASGWSTPKSTACR